MVAVVIMRILNNNAVITLDEYGQEKIVCGRGIAFKKRVGDTIPESAVNKVFVAQDREERQKMAALLAEIPLEHLQITDEIMVMIRSELGKELSPSIYLNISDHIHTAVRRHQSGYAVTNSLLWDIKRYYGKEYKLSLKALDIIEKQLGLRLPDDEAGFIALHIVNAEMDEENLAQVYQITQIIQELCNLVRYHFTIDFDETTTDYYRFVTHLKFLARRLVEARQYEDHISDGLFSILIKKYPDTWACVQRISNFVEKKYHYALSEDEQIYLIIHIERVIHHGERE